MSHRIYQDISHEPGSSMSLDAMKASNPPPLQPRVHNRLTTPALIKKISVPSTRYIFRVMHRISEPSTGMPGSRSKCLVAYFESPTGLRHHHYNPESTPTPSAPPLPSPLASSSASPPFLALILHLACILSITSVIIIMKPVKQVILCRRLQVTVGGG